MDPSLGSRHAYAPSQHRRWLLQLRSRPLVSLPVPRCSVSSNSSQHEADAAAKTLVSRRHLALRGLGTTAILAGALAAGGAVVAAASLASSNGGGGGGSGGARRDPRLATRAGMDKFRANDVEGSVVDFDDVIAAAPQMRPYMWQRGLSLYYLGRFAEGAEQFRVDVAVNPNDTEESIWTFLCEAQLLGPEAARQQFLQVGRDPRPVMRTAYECFRTGQRPDQILAAAAGDNGGHDNFYGLLYVGLWHEAHGEPAEAREAITAAVRTPYARMSGDYMAALARVHCTRRGWEV